MAQKKQHSGQTPFHFRD